MTILQTSLNFYFNVYFCFLLMWYQQHLSGLFGPAVKFNCKKKEKQTRLQENNQEITAFEQRNNEIVLDSDLYGSF